MSASRQPPPPSTGADRAQRGDPPRPAASVVVPTRDRPTYLDVALASIMPQAHRAGAEVIVVDDGPRADTHALVARHGARYEAHQATRGLNAARNTGLDAACSELLVFVDDDVRALPGWLEALMSAADEHPEVGVFAGRILARFEDHPLRSCGREGPPITQLDLGSHDRPAPHAWGANMTVRRAALARAGRFDPDHQLYGDEQEFQARHRAGGGRILYVAAAAVEHRRAGDDARLRALARAAHHRGRASRRFDEAQGGAPSRSAEVITTAGCLAHAVRYRCLNGLVLAAHSAGRLRASLTGGGPPSRGRGGVAIARASARGTGAEDFLSGESGTVGGRRGQLRHGADRALDAWLTLTGRMAALDRAAAVSPARRRVLVLGIERPERSDVMARARAELEHSRHEVSVVTAPVGRAGKFENLNLLLASHPPANSDWLLVVDDDVTLPERFLDRFLYLVERFDLVLAQPAHRLHSHAAWRVTRRRPASAVRETAFVEIGPVTAFRREAHARLLPFPPLSMGWGLDVHWAALAQQQGWRMGVVDLTPVGHLLSPAGDAYDRAAAVGEAHSFLAERPYVAREHAQRTLQTHRSWRRP